MVKLHLYPSSIYTTIYYLSILPFIIYLYYHLSSIYTTILSFATRLQPRRQNLIGSSIDLFTINCLNVMMMMMMMMIAIRVFLIALRFQKFNHQPAIIYFLSFAKW